MYTLVLGLKSIKYLIYPIFADLIRDLRIKEVVVIPKIDINETKQHIIANETINSNALF